MLPLVIGSDVVGFDVAVAEGGVTVGGEGDRCEEFADI